MLEALDTIKFKYKILLVDVHRAQKVVHRVKSVVRKKTNHCNIRGLSTRRVSTKKVERNLTVVNQA